MPTDAINNLIRGDAYINRFTSISISVWALTGMGKSDFALSFPPPIFLLSFEPDGPYWAVKRNVEMGIVNPRLLLVDEVVTSALGNYEVWDYDDMELEEQKEIFIYVQEQVNNIIEMARQNKAEGRPPGTLIVDTSSSWWSIVNAVKLDPISKKREKQGKDLMQFDWQYANFAMKKFTERIKAAGLHVVLLHHSSDVYDGKGQRQPGKHVYRGWKQDPELADIHGRLNMRKEYHPTEEEQAELDANNGRFADGMYFDPYRRWFLVEKSRLSNTQVGIEIEDPTYDRIIEELMPEYHALTNGGNS